MPSDKTRIETLLRAIEALDLGETRIMEVCGTHTMSIAEAGIKSMLPSQIQLLSGPGCPVCVTPPQVIDQVLELAMEKDVVITSYGDMLRVPGSRPGDSLLRRRALGAKVETVYSPVDAVALAAEHPEKQVVFLGVGFETTAPGTAAAVLTAQEQGLQNFTVWSMLKEVEPALRALIAMDGFNIDGFLCPGHVATIIGERGFRYLPEEFDIDEWLAALNVSEPRASRVSWYVPERHEEYGTVYETPAPVSIELLAYDREGNSSTVQPAQKHSEKTIPVTQLYGPDQTLMLVEFAEPYDFSDTEYIEMNTDSPGVTGIKIKPSADS